MSAQNLSANQFRQLPMFMPAGELRSMPANAMDHKVTDIKGPDGSYVRGAVNRETTDQLWSRKTEQARGRGLAAHVADTGVYEPVELAGPGLKYKTGDPVEEGTILDGHHRTAAAYAADPASEVPVSWRSPAKPKRKVKP